MTDKKEFLWHKYPEAWQKLQGQIEKYKEMHPGINELSHRLYTTAGARLIDYIDYLVVDSESWVNDLLHMGYTRNGMLFTHQAALLPQVVLSTDSIKKTNNGIAIKVDNIAHFLMAHGLTRPTEIEGGTGSGFRRSEVFSVHGVSLWVVERRQAGIMQPVPRQPGYLRLYERTLDNWLTRPRFFTDEKAAMEHTLALAERQVMEAGKDLAAYLFFEAERRYWLSRNRAAGVLKYYLDRVGVGWAGHDHHTFRSSRKNFSKLLKFFTTLGFQLRERFFAGEEAGWGAQVVEHPVIGITLFLDVDLTADELDIEFLSHGLPEQAKVGTIGLWCALHGDSIFESGLHHLAVLADFEQLTTVMAKENVKMMKPFSTIPYLRQAFTHGEMWPVEDHRLQKLLKNDIISPESAKKFASYGAVGSHVENIQREDGYKGFSQKEVSQIIKETNPQNYE